MPGVPLWRRTAQRSARPAEPPGPCGARGRPPLRPGREAARALCAMQVPGRWRRQVPGRARRGVRRSAATQKSGCGCPAALDRPRRCTAVRTGGAGQGSGRPIDRGRRGHRQLRRGWGGSIPRVPSGERGAPRARPRPAQHGPCSLRIRAGGCSPRERLPPPHPILIFIFILLPILIPIPHPLATELPASGIGAKGSPCGMAERPALSRSAARGSGSGGCRTPARPRCARGDAAAAPRQARENRRRSPGPGCGSAPLPRGWAAAPLRSPGAVRAPSPARPPQPRRAGTVAPDNAGTGRAASASCQRFVGERET